MSRTDKDTPWWLTAEYWRPRHDRCKYARFGRDWIVCDLAPAPTLPMYRERSRHPHCTWMPIWDLRYHRKRNGRWIGYVDTFDNVPTRGLVRDMCRAAAKEYRGDGQVDTEPLTLQYNRCRTRLYSYYWGA